MPHMWSAICNDDVKGLTHFTKANKRAPGPVVLVVFDIECGHCKNLYHRILNEGGVYASAVAFHIKCDKSTEVLQKSKIGEFPHVYDVKKIRVDFQRRRKVPA